MRHIVRLVEPEGRAVEAVEVPARHRDGRVVCPEFVETDWADREHGGWGESGREHTRKWE